MAHIVVLLLWTQRVVQACVTTMAAAPWKPAAGIVSARRDGEELAVTSPWRWSVPTARTTKEVRPVFVCARACVFKLGCINNFPTWECICINAAVLASNGPIQPVLTGTGHYVLFFWSLGLWLYIGHVAWHHPMQSLLDVSNSCKRPKWMSHTKKCFKPRWAARPQYD